MTTSSVDDHQEQRETSGSTERREAAGSTEARAIAGSTEARDAERRDLGGAAQGEPTCRPDPACAGYVVSGEGPLRFFDGVRQREAVGRCVQ